MNSIINLEEGYSFRGTTILAINSVNDLWLMERGDLAVIYGENPFVQKKIIRKAIKNTKRYGAVESRSKIPDTLKLVKENDLVDRTIDRNNYRKTDFWMIGYNFMEKIMGHNFTEKVFDFASKHELIGRLEGKINRVLEIASKW